jgi:DHA3 family macrolide efflux protein-like MFS transporter
VSRQRGVLRNRAFLLLWVGLLISSVGDWVNYVAMVSVVFQQTHSTLMLTLLRLCHIVPILLVAPFAGVFVDRWSRKRTLVVSPLVAGLAVGALALFHPTPFVFLAYGAITVALTFFNPARSAALPSLVSDDQLVAANSLAQITSTASIVVGGLMGGLIVAAVGAPLAFAVDAISFIAVAVCVSLIHVPRSIGAGSISRVERELAEGVRHLWEPPIVGQVIVAGAIFVFAPATVLTLGIIFVRASLHAGAAGYGEILAGLGIGSAVGAAVMIAYRNRVRQEVAFAASGLLLGLGVAGLGLSQTVVPAMGFYGLAGFGSMVNTVSAVTLLQRLVPDRVRGRVFAVSSTFDHLGAFASTLAIGAGSGLLSAAQMITGSGIVAAVTGVLSLFLIRRR